MTGVRSGWYPYNPQLPAGHEHPSWQFLAGTWPWSRSTSFRRYWDGLQWEGGHLANADLLAIAVCPGCERQTGMLALTTGRRGDIWLDPSLADPVCYRIRERYPNDF